MKKLIIFLLLCGIATASIDFTIDGKELQQKYTADPGQQLEFELKTAPGVLIKKVDVQSDKHYYETLLNEELAGPYYRHTEERAKKFDIEIPKDVPSGESGIKVTVTYEDTNLDLKTTQYTTVLDVEGSAAIGAIASIASDQTMDEVLANLGAIDLKGEDKGLNEQDLNKKDYEALGLTAQDIIEGKKPEITETSSEEKIIKYEDAKVDKYKEHLKGDEHPDVVITKKTFDVKYGDKVLQKTKFHIKIPADKVLSEVSSVVIIPKEIAQNVKELQFSEQPEIIEADPVVKWMVNVVPENDEKEYTMVVDKNVGSATITAAASADKPGWFTGFIMWLVGMFK